MVPRCNGWFSLLLLFWSANLTYCQCPGRVLPPCSCTTTLYEPVNILCDGAASIQVAIAAIGAVQNGLIDSLTIINTSIPLLPGGIFQSLNVKRLVLNRNDLSQIHPQAFEGRIANTLEELDLRSNNLGQIPTVGVSTVLNLRTLILARNGITTIAPRAFEQYQSKSVLTKLDLSANQLRDVDPMALVGLTAIEQISLDKNFLNAVPTAALRQLSTLEDLSLGVNQLTEIPIGALSLPSLKSLSLEVNNIAFIDPEVFRGVPNLLYLYLSANKFAAIPAELFRHIPKLRVLTMGNNERIREVQSDAFRYIPGLVRLELSECSIDTIDADAIQKIPKVQVLVLNRNRMQSVVQRHFRGLTDLYSLDLKGNQINFIEDRSFAGLPSLKHLDLSSNKLTSLEPTTFLGTFERSDPPTSRSLYIYDNPWQCDERLTWFRQWLRSNMDVMIDAPGYPATICAKPDWLHSHKIRLPDPITPATTLKPFQKTDPTQIPLTGDDPQPKLSGLNLAAVLLGVILGILLLSILLLMFVRYLVGKSRRQHKEESEEVRRLGSSISGAQSAFGSAYPSPALPHSETPRQGYFLNRPWYWWF